MPIDANSFFQHAAALSDTAKVYVAQDETSVENKSGLHGLKKLSVSAHRAENAAAGRAFLNSVLNDPRYAEFAAEVRSPLERVINKGKPLTAGMVKQARQILEMHHAVKIGKELADSYKIPRGHGTSFAVFAAAKGHDLNTPDGIKQAIKDYYLGELVPKQLTLLTELPSIGSEKKNAAAEKILKNHCMPERGDNGFFAKALDKRLADFEHFSYADFSMSYSIDNDPLLNMMFELPDDFVDSLKNMQGAGNLLTALMEAQPFIGKDNFHAFVGYAMGSGASLRTAESRAQAVRDFMTEGAATKTAEPLMQKHNLPKEFATAIGHNPKVVELAKEYAAELAGKGQIPTEDQVHKALTRAIDGFTAENKALLSEFSQMAENPPVDIDPPLTKETMPRYLNMMIAGDAVLEPLLNESVEINEEFMQKLADYTEAMNSATHSIKGDFGTSDASMFMNDAIKLLMARRGVEPAQYNEVLARAVNKFGKLACELQSLNSMVNRGLGGANGMKFLSLGMGVFRALEGHAKALVSMMNHEQRVAFRLEEPQIADPNDREAMQRNGELYVDFLEKKFQSNVKPEHFSPALRAFAENHGIRIAQPAAPQGANLEQEKLFEANAGLGNAVISVYIASTGRLVEEMPQAFAEIFENVSQKHGLEGIDPHKLDISAFSLRVSHAVSSAVSDATQQGINVDTAKLHKIAENEITQGLLELKAVLEQVDGLPERTDFSPRAKLVNDEGKPMFSAEEKALIKECVVSSGLRDFDAITSFAHKAREKTPTVEEMSRPNANGKQLAETALSFAKAYVDVRNSLPEYFNGSDDSFKFMANLALKSSNLSQELTASLAENLDSEIARKTAGSFLWLRTTKDLSKVQSQQAFAVFQAFTELRNAVIVETKGNGEVDPMFFKTMEATHPSEIPAGSDSGCMFALKNFAGRTISDVEDKLAMHVPSFSREEWDTLSSVIDTMKKSAGKSPYAFLIPDMVASSSADILQAVRANNGKSLSPAQLWGCFLEGKPAKGLKNENAAETIVNSFMGQYKKLLKTMMTDASSTSIDQTIFSNFGANVSTKKMLELAKPGGSLSLQDTSLDFSMSSLRNVTEKNAFGLVTDFRRQASQATLSFKSLNGDTMSVHPHSISDEDNNPEYQVFKDIIAKVDSMTKSYAQKCRVMQAFSQSSLIFPRLFSTLFPGVLYDEHGNFVMEATEQADGSVIMDIRTDPNAPVLMHEQIRIETDGSHTFTVFDMRRA